MINPSDQPPAGPTREFETVDRAQLVLLAGDAVGKVHIVGASKVSIGRAEDATIRVFGDAVSRRHAELERNDKGQFVLRDLGSRNGTFVDGEPITERELRFGDRVQIGADTLFVFTHYDRIDEQLLQFQKLDSIGQLAGGMAHDFGNVLAVLVGNIDYLSDRARDGDDQELIDCLHDMKLAAERGGELTHRLLDISRQTPGNRQVLDVAELLEEVSHLMERMTGPQIEVQLQHRGRLTVHADRGGLHQILLNLCINARDAMDSGGQLRLSGERVTVAAESDQPFLVAGDYVLIRVADDGCGMDADTQRRIFEPFFTTKGSARGTGLGLASVYGIVRNHGGSVSVTSSPGRGSVFQVYLPYFHSDQIVSRPSRPLIEPPSVKDAVESRTLIVADSDALVRATATRILKRIGYQVLVVADGDELISLFRRRHAAIYAVFLDSVLMRAEDDDLLHDLRAINAAVPIIACSSTRGPEIEFCLRNGTLAAFVTKPFDVVSLENALEAAQQFEPLAADALKQTLTR